MNGKKELVKITEMKQDRPDWDTSFAPEVLEEKVIYERPGNKDGVYKIYKKKSYTEAEWKEYEEQLYQAYLRKKKGFWRSILP